jgi:hypothetical protein
MAVVQQIAVGGAVRADQIAASSEWWHAGLTAGTQAQQPRWLVGLRHHAGVCLL